MDSNLNFIFSIKYFYFLNYKEVKVEIDYYLLRKICFYFSIDYKHLLTIKYYIYYLNYLMLKLMKIIFNYFSFNSTEKIQSL